MKNEVSGTMGQSELIFSMKSILSDFDKSLALREARYTTEFAEAIRRTGDMWLMRDKMKGFWENYCGDSLAYTFGSRTSAFIFYQSREERNLLNWFLQLFFDNPRPDVTYEMLETDWDKLLESVLIIGSDYIDELRNSRPYVSNRNYRSYYYITLINKMVYSLVDGANIDKILKSHELRNGYLKLLEKVEAVELGEVRLGDSSLQLIHDVKMYF